MLVLVLRQPNKGELKSKNAKKNRFITLFSRNIFCSI
jgi:hypothetical protein